MKAVKNIIVAVIAAAAVFLVIMTLTGHRIYAVQSGSMEPAVKTGAAVMVDTRSVTGDVRTGDVICFEAPGGMPVIHRVIGITGEGIETKGDANNVSDGISTNAENYIGKVVLNVPVAGYVMAFLSSPRVRILILTALAVLIMISIYKKFTGKERKETEDAEITESQ